MSTTDPRRTTPWRLTPGQIRLLDTMLEAPSIKVAAERMAISISTVSDRLKDIYRSMGVTSGKAALVLWVQYRSADQPTHHAQALAIWAHEQGRASGSLQVDVSGALYVVSIARVIRQS